MSDNIHKKSKKRIQAEKKMRRRIERNNSSSRNFSDAKKRSNEIVKNYENSLRKNKSNPSRTNKYANIHELNSHKQKQNRHINIIFFLFVFIFCYIAYHIVSYAKIEEYPSTIVEPGKLINSQKFRAFIIRDEEVYRTSKGGKIKLFLNQSDKLRAGMNVAAIISDDEEIKILEESLGKASENLTIDTQIDDEVFEMMKKSFRNFTVNNNFKGVNYASQYSEKLKFDLNLIRESFLLSNSKYAEEYLRLKKKYDDKLFILKAEKSGILSFNLDGKENISLDNIDYKYISDLPESLDFHFKDNLKEGDGAFKIIDDYLWYTVMEIDGFCQKEIENQNYVKVLLGNEKEILYAKVFNIQNQNNKTYLTLQFDRKLIRFLDRRIIDLEIVYNDYSGLKLPSKAVSKKTFVKIPKEYLQYINGENSVLIEGEKDLFEIYAIPIFRIDGDYAWIPENNVTSVGKKVYLGDIQAKKNREFIIENSQIFEGAYIANKGYAEFKFIESIYEEDGFLVVKDNIPYGIRVFDRIITDSASTTEDALIGR